MSLYDWLLFLHVLSAFAVVTAQVVFTFVILASRRLEAAGEVLRVLRLSRPGEILIPIGSIGVLVFGLWIAIEDRGYEPWNGWIVAAIVLWALVAAVGVRAGKLYAAVNDRARTLVAEGRDGASPELAAMLRARKPLVLHIVSLAIVLLLLLDMIFKPGA